jgi:hypothetical protein
MDMGWIVTFASPTNATAQVSVMSKDESSSVNPDLTIEVSGGGLRHDPSRLRRSVTSRGRGL